MQMSEEASIRSCLKKLRPQLIVHLAAINEIDSLKDPLRALEVNTKGTYQLLHMAKKESVEKFIYFSTFHVYGESSASVISENTPTRPTHPYAISHHAAEDFVNYFRKYHNLETLILRVSNGYGYPMDKEVNRWTLVFNDCCRQAVTTGSIALCSSGRQYRDFIPLHDIARAVHHFIFIAPDKWQDGLFNLGGNNHMRILDVAKRIAKVYKNIYGQEIRIKTKPDNNPKMFQKPVHFSIEKLLRTGFRLEGDMDDEIAKTLRCCEGFL